MLELRRTSKPKRGRWQTVNLRGHHRSRLNFYTITKCGGCGRRIRMSVRSLIQLRREEFANHRFLREPSRAVEQFDGDLCKQVVDLTDTFEAHEIAVGLAAPQIGVQARICIVNIHKGKPRPHLVLINPGIVRQSETTEERFESCMSLPLFRGKVQRFTHITVQFQDAQGAKTSLDASGFLARVIQHEVDHLDGILYIDRMRDITTLEDTETPRFVA